MSTTKPNPALAIEHAYGPVLFLANLKSRPSDFCVNEKLDIEFSGQGEHLYLRIEKTERNTADVVNALKRCFKVPKKAIGFAGQKDRNAVTTQWFSVQTPQDESPLTQWLSSDDSPPFRLINHARHLKKLRIGAHEANEFVIRLRNVTALPEVFSETEGTLGAGRMSNLNDQSRSNFVSDVSDVRDVSDVSDVSDSSEAATQVAIERLRDAVRVREGQVKKQGFPNYFGPQRFGRDGANLPAAIDWLIGKDKIPSISRDKRSLFLSCIRSAAFNRVLSARVRQGNWNQIRDGEVCILNGSNSVFPVSASDKDDAIKRLHEMDVHPSAPLVGKERVVSGAEAASQDDTVLRDDPQHQRVVDALCKLRVDAAWRPTRALCEDLKVRWLDEDSLEFSMTLAPGVYATTLLNQFMKELTT